MISGKRIYQKKKKKERKKEKKEKRQESKKERRKKRKRKMISLRKGLEKVKMNLALVSVLHLAGS